MQINKWLHLSSSPWGIPFRCDMFRKNMEEKNFFLWQQITELYELFDGL